MSEPTPASSALVPEYCDFFAGKRVLITGGTGSFGHEILRQLLQLGPRHVVILSRDEKKQWDMRDEIGPTPVVRFVVGDVRDYETVAQAMRGIDVVYHAAALKQVPTCEEHPLEAVRTNVLGTENVRRAAIANGVRAVVLVSTDKAVKPVNVMGLTKALAERILLVETEGSTDTRFVCVRYGNVVGSRGSVIPLFQSRIAAGRPLPVTHPGMTRFLLTLPQAIQLVFKSTVEAESGALLVQKMPACYVGDLARAMSYALTKRDDYPIDYVGVRGGEKMHEVLVSEEEMLRAEETDSHFTIFRHGRIEPRAAEHSLGEYASNQVEILDREAICKLLASAGWI